MPDASLGYGYDQLLVRAKLANVLNELSYPMHDDNSTNPIAPPQLPGYGQLPAVGRYLRE